MLVRREIPSNLVTRLSLGPQRSGIKLMIDNVAAREPIPAFSPMIMKRVFGRR
jgi:hypothetical protein